MSSYQGSLANN